MSEKLPTWGEEILLPTGAKLGKEGTPSSHNKNLRYCVYGYHYNDDDLRPYFPGNDGFLGRII
jgi:hypothetical protein